MNLLARKQNQECLALTRPSDQSPLTFLSLNLPVHEVGPVTFSCVAGVAYLIFIRLQDLWTVDVKVL